MKKKIGIMMCIGCMCFCACTGEVMFTITESGSELFSVGDTFEFYD